MSRLNRVDLFLKGERDEAYWLLNDVRFVYCKNVAHTHIHTHTHTHTHTQSINQSIL